MDNRLTGPVTGLELLRIASRVERGIATELDAKRIRYAADTLASGIHTPDATPGVLRIAAERHRQIHEKGYSTEHDAGHSCDQLASAGACYALPLSDQRRYDAMFFNDKPQGWPFDKASWKSARVFDAGAGLAAMDPRNRIRELEKAGGLIAASLDLHLHLLSGVDAEGGAA